MLKKLVVLAIGGVVAVVPVSAGEKTLGDLLDESARLLSFKRDMRRAICPRTPDPRVCEADHDEEAILFIVAHAEQLQAWRKHDPSWSCEGSARCQAALQSSRNLQRRYERYETPPTQ